MPQLDLFQEPENPLRARLKAGADRLAKEGVMIGTSSWKYEGWQGILYDRERYVRRGRYSKARFEADCLEEYAETFHSVSVDATFYQFPNAAWLQKLARQVPDTFSFGFKATEEAAEYLDSELFRTRFLEPCEPIREQVGLIMFQFPKQAKDEHDAWLKRLDKFFAGLPQGWDFATEIRSRELLRNEYLDILEQHRVGHVYNSWTHMPTVSEQLDTIGDRLAGLPTACRLLLKPGRTYQQAVSKFMPYKTAKDIQEPTREAAARLIKEKKAGRKVNLYGNNRLEGCAPETLAAIIDRI